MLGIDQEIQRKVDAYRSNPQALQQRYAQNQELIDLLALQKLKSEKDAMARQMQMQMQQAPQTIKAQREQELLQRNKQELMQQTAGVMQNAQQRQAQNMQRVAREGAVTPAGLSAIAAPQRMAQGGIVAFQEGGITGSVRRGRTRRSLQEIADEYGITDVASARRALMEARQAPFPGELGAVLGGITTNPDLAALEQIAAQLEAAEPTATPEPTAETPPTADTVVAPPPPPPPPTGTGLAGQTGLAGAAPAPAPIAAPVGIPTLEAPKVNRREAADIGAARGKGIAGASGVLDTEPLVDYETAKTQLGAKETEEKFGGLGALVEQYKQRYEDPSEAAKQELFAFLRGTAGGTTIGQTLAGGSAAAAAERERQAKEGRATLKTIQEIKTAAIEAATDINKSAVERAQQAHDAVEANKRVTAQIMDNMAREEVRAAEAEADRLFQSDKAKYVGAIEQLRMQATQARDDRAAAGRDLIAAAKVSVDIENDVIERLSAPNGVLGIANINLAKAQRDGDEAEIQRATEARDAALELAKFIAEGVKNRTGINQTIAMLQRNAGMTVATPTPTEADIEAAIRAAEAE